MKKSVLILFTLVGICIGFVAYGRCTGTAGEPAVGTVASHAVPSPSSKEQRLQEKALAAKAYCIENGFNTNYCFLIDFSIPSGKNVSLSGTSKVTPSNIQVSVLMDMARRAR